MHGSQSFTAVNPTHFSPPTVTRTWFHQGQVQNSAGDWTESNYAVPPWPDDPPVFGPEQRNELNAIASASVANAEPTQLRHALRALRGSILRTELFALDSLPYSNRPYTVSEAQYDVREIEPFAHGTADRLRIFFPFQLANRTSQWERGMEPMTQFAFSGDYDAYGMPLSQLAVAVPRGRNPLLAQSAASTAPYLSTHSTSEYARRDDDATLYMVDRMCRGTQYEVLNDGSLTIFALRDLVASTKATLRIIGHTRTYYDGPAFTGLPLAQLGNFGAPVRGESLVFQDSFLTATFAPSDPLSLSPRPAYLSPQGVSSWPAEYPTEFKSLLPNLAGYLHYADADIAGSPGGYYVAGARHSYDFHDSTRTPRGLPMITRDALGADATIAYDTFDLLPISVSDPVGLTTLATYDYRVLQAGQITDSNGNTASFTFSPAGLLTAQSLRGKNGEGDAANPSVRME